MKTFNTTAICVKTKHYMVDISCIVEEITEMVDSGKYFTINRARQYGKTTILNALKKNLDGRYRVISLDFQDIEDGSYSSGGEFAKTMCRIIMDAADFENLYLPDEIRTKFEELSRKNTDDVKLDDLFRVFKQWLV